jgi:hypothetical protein
MLLRKTLKLLNYQGSGDLAGGGGFSPVLCPAKNFENMSDFQVQSW